MAQSAIQQISLNNCWDIETLGPMKLSGLTLYSRSSFGSCMGTAPPLCCRDVMEAHFDGIRCNLQETCTDIHFSGYSPSHIKKKQNKKMNKSLLCLHVLQVWVPFTSGINSLRLLGFVHYVIKLLL